MGYFGATELTLIMPPGVTIGTNTIPITLNEVATMIAEVSADLDTVAAGRGYAVPVSPTAATIAYLAMQQAAKQGVGARILQTLFPNMGGPGGKSTLADEYAAAYKAFKDGIRKGELVLPGAPMAATGGRVLPRSRSTSGEPTGMSASPAFPWEWSP